MAHLQRALAEFETTPVSYEFGTGPCFDLKPHDFGCKKEPRLDPHRVERMCY